MKCLVVDDSATMRRIVVNALKSIGYDNVVEAADGSDALQKCDGSIELVITDWNMPVMGGLELVRGLRANPAHSQDPGADGHHPEREGRHSSRPSRLASPATSSSRSRPRC